MKSRDLKLELQKRNLKLISFIERGEGFEIHLSEENLLSETYKTSILESIMKSKGFDVVRKSRGIYLLIKRVSYCPESLSPYLKSSCGNTIKSNHLNNPPTYKIMSIKLECNNCKVEIEVPKEVVPKLESLTPYEGYCENCSTNFFFIIDKEKNVYTRSETKSD